MNALDRLEEAFGGVLLVIETGILEFPDEDDVEEVTVSMPAVGTTTLVA